MKTLLTIAALLTFPVVCTAQVDQQQAAFNDSVDVIVDEPFDIELVEIPAGTLSWDGDYESHTTTKGMQSFYMGKYEVTQSQWEAVMGSYPVEFVWDDYPNDNAMLGSGRAVRMRELTTNTGFLGDDLPVETVGWDEVQEFLLKLSEATGHFYRLPTEAEWVYAYRSGTTTDYAFGDDTLLLGEYEWYDENAGGTTHPVGQKLPNPWGLYDMGGNVAEWTADLWDPAPYTRRNPGRDFGHAMYRVYRGSHYLHTKFAATVGWSHSFLQAYPHRCVGFRVVRAK